MWRLGVHYTRHMQMMWMSREREKTNNLWATCSHIRIICLVYDLRCFGFDDLLTRLLIARFSSSKWLLERASPCYMLYDILRSGLTITTSKNVINQIFARSGHLIPKHVRYTLNGKWYFIWNRLIELSKWGHKPFIT